MSQIDTVDSCAPEEPAAAECPPAPLLLRAPEAARLCNASLRTWRTWNTTGKIPRPVRIGHCVYWRPEELRAWVAAGCPDRVTWEMVRQL